MDYWWMAALSWIPYIALMAGGIAWIVYRTLVYLRNERERESRWTELASDDQFKEYLKTLGTNKTDDPDGSNQEKKEGGAAGSTE